MRKPMRYMACHLACWTHHHVEYNARGLSIIEVFSGTKARILNIRSLLCWKAQLGIICGQEANLYQLQFGSGTWRHTSDHLPPWRSNEGTSLEKEQFFDFLLKHLKLRLSVWLGKAELLSLALSLQGRQRSTSLGNALRMGKHTVIEIFDKKRSSAGAVLKGTAGHTMWERHYFEWWGCFAHAAGKLGPGFDQTAWIWAIATYTPWGMYLWSTCCTAACKRHTSANNMLQS